MAINITRKFAGICAVAAVSAAVGGLAQAAVDTLPSGAPVAPLYGKRFHKLTDADMTPEQKTMAHNVLTGPRGSLNGPFSAYIRSPELGDALQKVGEMVRFRSSFPVGLRELAVCQVARQWNSAYEWAAHSEQAVAGGISKETVDAIGQNRRPPHLKPEEAAIYDFTRDLLEKHAVSDAHFKEVQSRWGDKGVMDLTGAIGYFVVVAMALNVDVYPAPPGANPLPRLAMH
ncbi:MAG: carboxymuconolactone decarboxylase family protein [Pseudomonadota bacterium]